MFSLTPPSLHVGYFSIEKRHLQILVDIDLLGAQIDDLVWRSERGFHLIGGLTFFNLLGFGRGRLLLRLSSTATLLISALLVITITIAALLSALVAATVIDGKQSGDRVFHLGGVGVGQRSFGELKNHVGLVERLRIGVVTGIAGDDADDHLVFLQTDGELGGIDLCVLLEKLGGWRLLPNFTHEVAEDLLPNRIRGVNRSAFIFGGENILVGIRHTEDSALLDHQDGALLHYGSSA